MHRLWCLVVIGALAVAVSVVGAGPAVAAKGGNATAQACKKGGWTLGTFANQGDCVNDGAQATTATFNWTGEAQTWTVPDGVTKATFDLYGAEGGLAERKSSGGKGGRATATIPVSEGSSVQVNVGGQGQSNANPAEGGFNGGGIGQLGGGGGGASDIRIDGTDLANRVLVAGGGGGGGNCGVTRGGPQTDGGDGGGTSGDDAFTSRLCAEEGIVGGGGGTQDAGGTAEKGPLTRLQSFARAATGAASIATNAAVIIVRGLMAPPFNRRRDATPAGSKASRGIPPRENAIEISHGRRLRLSPHDQVRHGGRAAQGPIDLGGLP